MSLMIGVSGIRGLINETLTPELALRAGEAYGTFLGGGRLVLGRDSRPSGELFMDALEAGLLATGCEVTRVGIAMTPTVGHAIRTGGFDGGAIITASHNPAQWNGIKFLDERGVAPDPNKAGRIRELLQAANPTRITSGFQPVTRDRDAGRRHMQAVLDAIEVDLAPLRGAKIVLDSVNGAGCEFGRQFLESVGCEVIHLNGTPDGNFAHTPEPIAENLTDLCAAVRKHSAAAGFAQDPDADRLAIVDGDGTFIGEEYTLALSVASVLARRPGPVAANLSTSRLIDAIAARYHVPVIRTAVGEANVATGMLEHNAVLGGEGNGGVIDPRISWVRDSLSAMSFVLQAMAATGHPISALVDDLPRYAMIKEKFECPRERIDAATGKVAEAFASEKLSTVDGTRVDFDAGWVHVRASNTEPIIRIMAEAEDEPTARDLIDRVKAASGLDSAGS